MTWVRTNPSSARDTHKESSHDYTFQGGIRIMSSPILFLKLAAIVAVAAMGFAPAARAQSNPGQVVQAVVKLNQAQLAFVKKLADDPTFASQFEAATSAGNYDAAASLAASATGIAKSSITVGPKGTRAGDHDAASAATTPTTVFHMASFAPRAATRKGATRGAICFNLGWVAGCLEWA
jgi:hypothetical protein